MEHFELVQEMPSIERMTTQDRLKHARKRRVQQLKKWTQYEKQLDKETTKKRKKQEPPPQQHQRKRQKKSERVRFVANIALLESAARNDLDEVRRLLETGVSPDVTNEDGLTALHQCCIDDNEEMLKLLLEFGANVNACDSEMWTPLHAAATCGHVTLCTHLIDRGAELLAVNADGNMPYDICEDEITLDYIETEMAKRGITQEQIDETRLTTERQMLNDLKDYIAKGGDLEFKDDQGATMLHIAAANGFTDVTELLLDHHVSVDSRDGDSWQPIHAAAYWAQLEILELLVQSGADLDSKTKNGETPFDLCEDPDIKQRILDMKDEIETNKASRHRQGSSRKHKGHSRNLGHHSHPDSMYSSNTSLNSKPSTSASMRRTSLRGEKSNLFKKEAHEEALHFGLRLMQDEEELAELEEEKENLPATNIDDVTLTIDDHDSPKKTSSKPSSPPSSHNNVQPPSRSDQKSSRADDGRISADRLPGGDRLVEHSKPTPVPRHSLTNQGRQGPPPGSAGSTLNELKHHRSESRDPPAADKDPHRDVLDAQFQNMFLENLPNRGMRPNSTTSTSSQQPQLQFYPPPMMERAKNGHNNNNNANPSTTATTNNAHNANAHSNFREGQLRRFVAPPSAPVVGAEEEEKKSCCVIL